jgi:O-acetylserine/cysteine efflux transporter
MVFGALQWGLIYAGLQLGVSPGIASLVTQTAVFMTMGLGVFFFKERIERALLLGTLISFCGILLIFLNTEGQASLLRLFLVVGGAAGWAISNVIVKKSKSTEMFAFLIWSSLFAPLPLILMSFCVSGMDKISASITHIDSAAIASIAFQVYPTTLLGYSVWNHFMRKYPVSSVAPLALFVPVFGILASVVIFHESLPGYKIVAMLCIFSGLLVQRFGGIVLDRKTVA